MEKKKIKVEKATDTKQIACQYRFCTNTIHIHTAFMTSNKIYVELKSIDFVQAIECCYVIYTAFSHSIQNRARQLFKQIFPQNSKVANDTGRQILYADTRHTYQLKYKSIQPIFITFLLLLMIFSAIFFFWWRYYFTNKQYPRKMISYIWAMEAICCWRTKSFGMSCFFRIMPMYTNLLASPSLKSLN